MQGSAENQNPESMIGKSIVIKGEITASAPLHVYGRVEGSINAPEQRVTIAREGKAKANIRAREVVILGDVRGDLDGDRAEIRSSGSLTGKLAANRISIEEGAVLKGSIDVRGPKEKESVKPQEKLLSAEELLETEPAFDREVLAASVAS